jgi:DNA (cytosine-5)-methyltransferase 1
MIRPIGVDLFSGAGGMSLGFEQSGFDIVAAVEIDPRHCHTHQYNFPKTEMICSSVVDMTGEKIRKQSLLGDKDLDVVFGGAPCQGFSLLGKRLLDDPRNQLVFHYARLVKELQPKYFVFENVKGLTIGKHSQFLTELIEALDRENYNVLLPYKVLNAANFGVAQNRHRLFLLGARKGLPLPNYPNPVENKITVWKAICDIIDPTKPQYNNTITVHSKEVEQRFLNTAYGKKEPISHFYKLDPNGLSNTVLTGARLIHPFAPRVITVREAARLHSYPDWFRFHDSIKTGLKQVGNSVPPLLAQAVAGEIYKVLITK